MYSNESFAQLPVRQVNGCRHFGPRKEHQSFTPPRGSEIFLARIPQDFPHNELLKICHIPGEVYDVRLMVTFLKENKGFAFVKYFSPGMASKAIRCLNGYRLPGRHRGHLVAMFSTDHTTLMLTGCSPGVIKKDVEQVFRDIDGLVSVTEELRQGHASPVFYLLFASHRSAALMKKSHWRELIPRYWGVWVDLDWQPNFEVEQRTLLKREFQKGSGFMCKRLSMSPGLRNPSANFGVLASGPSTSSMRVQPSVNNMLGEASNAVTLDYESLMPMNVSGQARNRDSDSLRPENFLPHRRSYNIAQGLSPLSTLNQRTDIGREQMDFESALLTPENFLQHIRTHETAQSPTDSMPLRQLAGNSQNQWVLGNSSQNQDSFCLEPASASGGAPLGQNGTAQEHWIFEDSSNSRASFSFNPAGALGGSPPLNQLEDERDENSQTHDSSLLPRFGRPIRGRGNNDQVPKTMRF